MGARDDLNPYFRLLYNIVKFVDGADLVEKKRYTNIIRAQLSESELTLLAINLETPPGEGFRKLAEKYDLLKHRPDQFSITGAAIEDGLQRLRNAYAIR